MSSVARRPRLRSRAGCKRCRTRHQKCDESSPTCGRCFESGSVCLYQKRRSAHPRTLAHVKTTSTVPSLTSTIISTYHGYGDVIGRLNGDQRELLMYFVEEASLSISCHESIKSDTCTALISGGSSYPCFLHSCLLFAALHRASARGCSVQPVVLDVQALTLQARALSGLRTELLDTTRSNSSAALATVLMLATTELRYNPQAGIWRTHLESLRHLLGSSMSEKLEQIRSDTFRTFVRRRFLMMDLLLSLPTPWLLRQNGQSVQPQPDSLPCVDPVGVIDESLAISTELLAVFRWIRFLVDRQRCAQAAGRSAQQDGTADNRSVATSLIEIIVKMMARDIHTPPVVCGELHHQLTQSQLDVYRTCNRAAQSMALLCCYRHGLGRAKSSDCVRNLVHIVISLVRALPPESGLSPAICLTTPLFVAGCDAQDVHRGQILALLQAQFEATKNANAHRAMQVLNRLWASSDQGVCEQLPLDNTGKCLPFLHLKD